MKVLGLDIGGANIKAADSTGNAVCVPFPLWKKPDRLAEFLDQEVVDRFADVTSIALTMTGELCDCFASKANGVAAIIEAAERAFSGTRLAIYTTEGKFISTGQALNEPAKVAASNWHALASFAIRFRPSAKQEVIAQPDTARSQCDSTHLNRQNAEPDSMLVDIGSTTTDLIPLSFQVAARGSTDTTRIENHELVYTGSSRTAVSSVCQQIQFRDQTVAIAQETFATMADVYTLLGDRTENPENFETADGRSLTKVNCQRRLARMLCADLTEVTENEILDLARQAKEKQCDLIRSAIEAQMAARRLAVNAFLVSGSGGFIFQTIRRHFPQAVVIDLNQELGSRISESAAAYAVAKLREESK